MTRERGKHVGQIIAGEFSINILHLCSLTIPLLFSMTIIIDTEVITKNQLFLSTGYKKGKPINVLSMYELWSPYFNYFTCHIYIAYGRQRCDYKKLEQTPFFMPIDIYLYISCLVNWNFHYAAWNIKRHKTGMWYKSIHYIPCFIRTAGQSGIWADYYYMHQGRNIWTSPRVIGNKLITPVQSKLSLAGWLSKLGLNNRFVHVKKPNLKG